MGSLIFCTMNIFPENILDFVADGCQGFSIPTLPKTTQTIHCYYFILGKTRFESIIKYQENIDLKQ